MGSLSQARFGDRLLPTCAGAVGASEFDGNGALRSTGSNDLRGFGSDLDVTIFLECRARPRHSRNHLQFTSKSNAIAFVVVSAKFAYQSFGCPRCASVPAVVGEATRFHIRDQGTF